MSYTRPGLVKKSYLPEGRSRLEKRRRHEGKIQSSPMTGDVVVINLSLMRKVVVREVACVSVKKSWKSL